MSKKFFVKQDDLKDCGVSSLLMIIRYYGGNAPKEYLRMLTNTNKYGTSFLDISYAANKFNFDSFGITGDIDELELSYLPIIAHVIIDKKFQHFIVILDYDKENEILLIADPASKIKKISKEEMMNISTSNYLVLQPRGKILNIASSNLFISTLKKIIKDNKLSLIISFIESLIYTLLAIISTFFISCISVYINTPLFIDIIILFSIISLFKEFIGYFRNKLIIKWSMNVDRQLQDNIYSHIFSLSNFYYKTRTTGEILSKINDMDNVKNTICNLLVSLLLDVTLLMVSYIAMLNINIELSFIVCSYFLIYILIFIKYKNNLKNKLTVIKEEVRGRDSFLIDTISNVESIKNMDSSKYVIDKYKLLFNKYSKSIYNYQKVINDRNTINNIIESLFQIGLIAIGFILVINNEITKENLMTYIFLLNFANEAIKNMLDYYINFEDSKLSITRIKEFYEVPKKNSFELDNNIQSIKIINLGYKYRKNKPILNNINLNLLHYDKVLLLGSSGSGKSTLINIMAGLINDYTGTIKINNKEIKNENISKRVALLSQNESLLNTTIKENILMGRTCNDEKFNKITSMLKIDKIIENCPLAYNTLIEENGVNLSGGERQKIMIARTLLKDADMYIFDESLCNLDINLEREIITNIFTYLKDKIVVVVSHRFYNKDLFNRIIRIENGGIKNEDNK